MKNINSIASVIFVIMVIFGFLMAFSGASGYVEELTNLGFLGGVMAFSGFLGLLLELHHYNLKQ